MQPPLLLSFALLSSICFGSDQYPKNIKLLVLENLNTAQIRNVENLKIEVEVLSFHFWIGSNPPFITCELIWRSANRFKESAENARVKLPQPCTEIKKSSQNEKFDVEKFNIEVFPAAVVDNRFVFYGTDDLLLVIRKWRALQ